MNQTTGETEFMQRELAFMKRKMEAEALPTPLCDGLMKETTEEKEVRRKREAELSFSHTTERFAVEARLNETYERAAVTWADGFSLRDAELEMAKRIQRIVSEHARYYLSEGEGRYMQVTPAGLKRLEYWIQDRAHVFVLANRVADIPEHLVVGLARAYFARDVNRLAGEITVKAGGPLTQTFVAHAPQPPPRPESKLATKVETKPVPPAEKPTRSVADQMAIEAEARSVIVSLNQR